MPMSPKMLSSEASDEDYKRWADFQTALNTSDLDLLAKTLDEGLDLNIRWPKLDGKGRNVSIAGRNTYIALRAARPGTLLHEAARVGNADVIEVLLARGIDVNIASLNGSTALHESIFVSNNEVMGLLIKHGIDVNRRMADGFSYGDGIATAVQMAARGRDMDAVKLLLGNGAVPDGKCVEHTLLNDDVPMLQIMLRYGAPLDLKLAAVQTARVRAEWRGQKRIYRLLSGDYNVDEFVGLEEGKLEDMLHECERPHKGLIRYLRKSLEEWLNRPTERKYVSKDRLCASCENVMASSTLLVPSEDALSIKLNACPLCRVIFDENMPYGKKRYEKVNTSQKLKVDFPNEKPLDYEKRTGTLDIGFPKGQLAQILAKLQTSIDTGTSSSGTMALARTWLLHCLTEHSTCSATTTTLTDLPTRVIDVGSDYQEPHLHVTSGSSGIYCALSYCWGRHPFLRTTKSTLSIRQTSISLQDLPKTLRDAVLISRQLGIQYIWIDALCIVQDDKEDWARESMAMASIYQNAVITLIAGRADDTEKGCFQPRARNRVWPVKIPDRLTRRDRRTLQHDSYSSRWNLSKDIWRELPPLYPTGPQSNLYMFPEFVEREKGPTDTRAWCAQEHFMSRRVLLFTDEVYWECQCFIASEARPGGTSHPEYVAKKKALEASSITKPKVVDEVEMDSVLAAWELTIENYAQRQITMQSDRLVALAGMSEVVGKYIGCQFLAGLWSGENLCRSLLWEIWHVGTGDEEVKLDSNRTHQRISPKSHNQLEKSKGETRDPVLFPSWSWASCLSGYDCVAYRRWDEPMRANKKPPRVPTEVADIISTHVENIFTTEPVRGILVFRGRLRRMRVVQDYAGDDSKEMARNIVRLVPQEEITDEVGLWKSPVTDQEDCGLSESPPIKETRSYNIIKESAPKECLEELNDTLETKSQKRMEKTKTAGSSSGDALSHGFRDLFSSLQRLQDLKMQQHEGGRVPVPIQKRKHFWIKDRLESVSLETWCLAIAFWEDEIIGLCLEPTGSRDNEFRRVGLCSFIRSGNPAWEEDIVFEGWHSAEKITVSIS